MLGFAYQSEIIKRYPEVCGGVLIVKEAENKPSPERLKEEFQKEQVKVKIQIGDMPLSELETLMAWRGVFRSFGVDPTKYRSAAEALLRRLVKKGDIPSINTMVDICNLVSIRNALPVAAFDAKHVEGIITVCFADGSETFIAHDQEAVEFPEPGEVIFQDESGQVFARRWCWKQSQQSEVADKTNEAIITIEAQHPGSFQMIDQALNDLKGYLEKFVGGKYKRGILGKNMQEIYTE